MDTIKTLVPGYVYGEVDDKNSLFQGDILEVSGAFRLRFKAYYPKITHEPFERKYAMVISQSCDLFRRGSAGKPNEFMRPNLNHVVVCLVRPFTKVMASELELAGSIKKGDLHLLNSSKYEGYLTKAARLINNSNAKNLFFLPRRRDSQPHEDSVAILNVAFSFRTSCYHELLASRVATLRPEFRAKIGFLLADYYGRVATGDLLESGWSESDLYRYAKQSLREAGIVDAVNDSFIKSAGPFNSLDELEKAVESFKVQEELKKLDPVIRATRKQVSGDIFKLLKDPAEVQRLQNLKDSALRRELTARMKLVISNEIEL